MLDNLVPRKTTTLWLLFVATLVLTLTFALLSNWLGISFIDGLSKPAEVRSALQSMTLEQRHAHAWITATVDVAYPFAYGLLFAGASMRFFPRKGKYIAPFALLAIPVDLLEGIVQVLALTQVTDLLAAKTFVTPLKTICFLYGLMATLAGAALAGGRWLRQKLS